MNTQEYRSFAALNYEEILQYWLSCLETEDEENDATKVLAKACHSLLSVDSPPLLSHLFGQGAGTRISDFSQGERQAVLNTHCAMVSRGDAGQVPLVFPLDSSQRLAVHRFLHLEQNGAIAVSGAPGTGKTDMLRAVISSIWTKAAIECAPCPIIIICGATNQSVENVMGSFDGAVEKGEVITLRSRWINEVTDYAISSPSKSKSKIHEAEYHVAYPDSKKGIIFAGKAEALNDHNAESFPKLVATFIHSMADVFREERFSCPGSYFGFLAKRDNNIINRLFKQTENQETDTALKAIKGAAELLHGYLLSAYQQQKTLRLELIKALFEDRFNNLPLIQGLEIFVQQFDEHDGLNLAFKNICKAKDQTTQEYLLAVEGFIDVTIRPVGLHLAARYWEAQWLKGLAAPIPGHKDKKRLYALRRTSMLFPCLVSTLHSVCRLLDVSTYDETKHIHSAIDMLVIDESGQASPHLGGVVMGYARKALVVGDLKQLAPVVTQSPEADLQKAANFTKDITEWQRRGLLEVGGSVMRFVGTGASYCEPEKHGILLRRHYRCLESIIGYCIELLYHDHDYDADGNILQQELQPQVKDLPLVDWQDTTGKGFPLAPMNFIQCGSVNDEPLKEESWTNKGEALKIIRWLTEDGKCLVDWYKNAKGKTVDLTDIVAILTPFSGQAKILRTLLKEHLDAQFPQADGKPLSERMVIGTVHTMQGAERDVILFSGVSKECTATSNADADRDKVFLDRDGGNLLNVAISRAKKAFILFGHADLFFSPQAMLPTNDLPTAVLGRYMVKCGVKLAPKALVIVESPLKAQAIQDYLPDEFEVYGTGGHIRDLANLNLTPDNEFEPQWELVSEEARLSLQRTMIRLLQTPYLILATDPDPQGEAIAWHVIQVLKLHPWFSHIKVISRVVFSSITEDEIRSVFREPRNTLELDETTAPEAVLDMNLVHAALALRVLDGAIGAYYKRRHKLSMGRVQSAVLHLLAGTDADFYVLDLVLTNAQGDYFTATLIDLSATGNGEERVFSSKDDAEALAKKISNRSLPNYTLLGETTEIIEPPEPLGTADVLALAWERYGFTPQQTTTFLQELYTGSPVEPPTSPPNHKQHDPPVILQYGRLTLTEIGWERIHQLQTHEPHLSKIQTSQTIEADLDRLAAGETTYDTLLQNWSERIFSKPPQSSPHPDGTFEDPLLWDSFPKEFPPNKYSSVGNLESFREFLSTIEPSETIQSRANADTSMSGSLAHPPLMPLNMDEFPDNLSKEAQQLYIMMKQHTQATVCKEALLSVQNVLYTSTDGTMGLLVKVAKSMLQEGFYALYPEAKSDIERRYAPETFLEELGGYRIQVAGIRASHYPSLTPANTLLLMQRMGLGRPSTYAEHFRKLTAVH